MYYWHDSCISYRQIQLVIYVMCSLEAPPVLQGHSRTKSDFMTVRAWIADYLKNEGSL